VPLPCVFDVCGFWTPDLVYLSCRSFGWGLFGVMHVRRGGTFETWSVKCTQVFYCCVRFAVRVKDRSE